MSVHRTVSFGSRVSYSPALQWSPHMDISLSTEGGVNVMEVLNNVYDTSSVLGVRMTKLLPPEETMEFDTGIKREVLQAQIASSSSSDEMFPLMLDRTVSPGVQSMTSYKAYKMALWSPPQMDEQGSPVLATLTLDHRLSLNQLTMALHRWKQIVDLSVKFHNHIKQSNFSILKSRVDGTQTNLHVHQQRTHLLASVAITWSSKYASSAGSGPLPAKKVKNSGGQGAPQAFAVLASAQRSGHLVCWKINSPLSQESDVSVLKVMDISIHKPSRIQWCTVDDTTGFIALGYHNGLIKVMAICREPGTDNFEFGSISELWKDEDNIVLADLCWNRKERILYAAKGPYLFAFEVQIKMKSMEVAVVRSNHILVSASLPLNGLWYNSPHLYVSAQDGKLHSVDTIRAQASSMPVRSHGVCLSPNAVFMAHSESPAAFYCHLTLKEPLKVQIVSWKSTEEVVALILNATNESLEPIQDALVFIKKLYSQEEKYPPELEILVSQDDYYHMLSMYHLKLVRFLLLIKFSKLSRNIYREEDEEFQQHKALLNRKIEDLEQEILQRHVESSLTQLLAEQEGQHYTNQERTSALLMCEWLTSNRAGVSTNESDMTSKVRERLGDATISNETGACMETCKLCKQLIPLTSWKNDQCPSGHAYARCVNSLLLCQDLPIRKCQVCSLYSTKRSEQGFGWLSSSLGLCLYCDGRLL